MTFETHLEKSKVPEWRNVYIQYTLMKKMLRIFSKVAQLESKEDKRDHHALLTYQLQKRKKMPSFTLSEDLEAKLINIETDFHTFFHAEMEKCNQFFTLHLSQCEIKLKKLNQNILIHNEKRNKNEQLKKEIQKLERNYEIIKQSSSNLYRETYLLDQFAQKNKIAAQKTLKHYKEKAFFMKGTSSNIKQLQQFLSTLEVFQESLKLSQLKEDIETIYLTYFTKENPQKGLDILRLESKEKVLTSKHLFQYGFFLGFAIILLVHISLDRVSFLSQVSPKYDLIFPMFRGISLFLLYFWLYALNVYGWTLSHINYRQIFRFNYHYSSVYQILRRISFFTMFFLIVFAISVEKEIADKEKENGVIYYSPVIEAIPMRPEFGPLIIWGVIIFYMCIPTKTILFGQGRRYFWRLMLDCLITVFIPMQFVISWATDQYVSFVGPFKDVSYTICYYYRYFAYDDKNPSECANPKNIESGLIAACLPLILRMIQCGRQGYDKGEFFLTEFFYNFIKYLVSLSVALCSYGSKFYPNFFYPWLFFAATSMIYSYWWDVMKDWKFFQPDTKYKFLRKQLAYDSPKVYYSIMIVNLFLRLSWMLTISPNIANTLGIRGQVMVFILSFLEMFRSSSKDNYQCFFIGCLWNFIRVEREHIVNLGAFKAVPDVVFPYDWNEYEKGLAAEKTEKSKVEPINLTNSQQSLRTMSGSSGGGEQQQEPDVFQDQYSNLQQQEENLISNFSSSVTEGQFRDSLGLFQKRIDNMKHEYNDTLKKIELEVKEVEELINNIKAKRK